MGLAHVTLWPNWDENPGLLTLSLLFLLPYLAASSLWKERKKREREEKSNHLCVLNTASHFFLFLVCLAAVTVLHGGCSLPHSHLPLCPQPASPPIHREAQSQGHPLSPSLLPFTDKEITRTVSFPWAQEKELSLFLPAISPTYTSLLPPRTQPNGHFQHLSHKSLRPSRPFSST